MPEERRGIQCKVAEAQNKDVGRAYARMAPEDLERLGVEVGDFVQVIGKYNTACKAMPAQRDKEDHGQQSPLIYDPDSKDFQAVPDQVDKRYATDTWEETIAKAASTIAVQLDGITRENAGAGLDDTVEVHPIECQPSKRIEVSPINVNLKSGDLRYVSLFEGLPLQRGDRVRATLMGSRTADFRVESTDPKGPVYIVPSTKLAISERKKESQKEQETERAVSYEDIGGIQSQLQHIREMIELPLRFPEVFERLGIEAPKGVLLHGPPGCGKTLIARAIAYEAEAQFFSVSGPEIMHKFYGESEAHLRNIFEEATKHGPSIIFLDEIDAIAPRREQVGGDVEKRVVAQLLALMDGLTSRQNVVVIAATNIPNVIDPALRRPGRFDREIEIPIPDRRGRLQILQVHSRGMSMAEDVNLERMAEITHGFVGADLEALCRESAMNCLRRVVPEFDFTMTRLPYEQLIKLQISMDDFRAALHEVEASAIREVFVDVPPVKWDEIGGLSTAKERLQEAVEWPLKYPHLFEQAGISPPKGILLDGPPGTGKTLLAKAIANESNVNLISVKGPSLLSMYVGESERGIRESFHKARQAAPCILFFDEIDALLPTRSGGIAESRVTEQVLSQFLAEMDGIEELKGVLVLGATNRMDKLDPAALRPGRFDELVHLPLPNEQDRKEIFEIHLRDKPLASGIDINRLAVRTEGLSGAMISGICDAMARRAVRRAVADIEKVSNEQQDLEVHITPEDVENALAELIATEEEEPHHEQTQSESIQ